MPRRKAKYSSWPRGRTVAERFWEKVNKGDGTGCWLWTGTASHGYGELKIDGRTRKATHIALQLAGVVVPPGATVLHTCDVRPCVKRGHLKVGTCRDNSDDKVAKGRQPCGENHGRAKVTARQVRQIRRLYRAGGTTHKQLGRRFRLAKGSVASIVNRKNWKHIPD